MSCFGGHDEQIYLIEILIDKLTMTPDKIRDVAGHPIVIKIKLSDLPVFEFTRDDSDASRRDQDLSFMAGKCYVFVKRPRDLVAMLRSTCMRVGVFRAADTYPTAETELTLPGCLCDQIGMIGNQPGDRPPSFAVRGGFHLLDPGQNPSGTLHMELVVACLGRGLFAHHYELHPKSPVAAGDDDTEREIGVRRYVPAEYLRKRAPKEAHEEIAPTAQVAKRKAKAGKKAAKAGKKKKGKK